MRMSENRTTEIRSNQGPSVIGIIITLLEGSEDPYLPTLIHIHT